MFFLSFFSFFFFCFSLFFSVFSLCFFFFFSFFPFVVGVVIFLPLLGERSPLPSWLPPKPLVGGEGVSHSLLGWAVSPSFLVAPLSPCCWLGGPPLNSSFFGLLSLPPWLFGPSPSLLVGGEGGCPPLSLTLSGYLS